MKVSRPPRFSVVIPTCHRNDDLVACLERLTPRAHGADVPSEVIISDDGVATTAEAVVQERFPWARWMAGPRRGPAANRNHGAAAARGEWLVFLDDDCLPDPGLLAGYAGAARDRGTEVLEGRTLADGPRLRIDMECPANENGGFLWSCNFAIRRELFQRLGGFDERFPGPAMEDVDLRTRLQRQHVAMGFVPGALVLHPWRRRKGASHIRLHAMSVEYFIAKHPETRPQFSWREISYGLARRICLHYPGLIWRHRGAGLARDFALSCLFAREAIRAGRRAHARAGRENSPLSGRTELEAGK